MPVDIVGAIQSYGSREWSVRDLVLTLGGTGPVAAALLGVQYGRGVSKTPGYSAAQRNVQRYLQGTRRPSPATQAKLNQIGNKAVPPPPPGQFTLSGIIGVNGYGENYERDRTIDLPSHIDEDEWNEIWAEAMDGDAEGIWDAISDAYGVESMYMTEGEIDIH